MRPMKELTGIHLLYDKLKKAIENIGIIDHEYEDSVEKIEHLMIEFRHYDSYPEYADFCAALIESPIEFGVFKMLLNYIDVNSMCNGENCTILIDFLIHRRNDIMNNISPTPEKIMCMLDHVFDINKMDRDGDTALSVYINMYSRKHFILSDNISKIISKMLELGADIFIKNHIGKSVIDYAISFNNYDLLNLVLRDAQINMTILCLAFALKSNYDVIELLLQKLDDINGKDERGWGIGLMVRLYNPDDDIVELLKMHGADI